LGFERTQTGVGPLGGLVGRVADDGSLVRVDVGPTFDLGFGAVPTHVVGFPAEHGGVVVAVLVLAYLERPSDEQLESLSNVLGQVAIALVNAAAFRRARDLAAELEASQVELLASSQILEQTNASLQEANRYKSEFIANMSHEFRTPLNSILGYADLVGLSELDPEGQSYLERLRKAGRALLGLIEDLLSYSRIESGKDEVRASTFRLEAVLREVEASLESLVSDGVEVQVRGGGAFDEVCTDRGKLLQILTNLAGNAAKFTDAGRITLEATVDEAFVRLAVRDTGAGIPAEHQAGIFEAFRQVDGSATRKHGGTGLGLAITSRLTRLLGGRLELESTEGEGSCFTAVLPRSLELNEEARLDQAELRVLVLGDPGGQLDRLVAGLKGEGAQVAAKTLAEVEGAALTSPPDAVVIDLGEDGLPGLRGLQALRSREDLASVAVIAVWSEGGDPRALDVVANEYLTKPVDAQALCAAVRRCLGASAGHVLIVDDDEGSRELASAVLDRAGYAVETAVDGVEGLERMHGNPPGAVVLDLMMPGLTGFDVLATMAGDPVLRGIPVVVLTAKDLDAEERRRLSTGVADVVQKASSDVWPRLLRAIEESGSKPVGAGAGRRDGGANG
jgi:signal transduction histidine kinase/CheY-like chemotaxis protein